VPDQRGRLDTLLLPGPFRPQDGTGFQLRPGIGTEIGRELGGSDPHHLRGHRGIARRKVEQQLAVEGESLRIDRPPRSPRAVRAENGIAGLAREGEAVGRHRVADRVARPVAIGLVKQVHASLEHERPGRAEAVLIASLLGPQLADLFPVQKVLALRDADRPAFGRIRRSKFRVERRQRKVHQVAVLETHHRGVFRIGSPQPRLICPAHFGFTRSAHSHGRPNHHRRHPHHVQSPIRLAREPSRRARFVMTIPRGGAVPQRVKRPDRNSGGDSAWPPSAPGASEFSDDRAEGDCLY